LPTKEEVLRIIKFAGNPRDKCMIAMSFDLGTRPHELLSVNIGNVRFDEYGATVTVGKSKSMKRTLRLISSLPYLREWFENHPYNDNPDAPLFIGLGNTQFGNRIEPQTLRYALQQAAKRAGITKRIYTYQLRHSSVTQNAVIGLTEQQLKAFYGWRPASKMLNVYSHITSEDVNHARLAQAGKIEIEKKSPKIELLTCPRCGAENPPTHEYCSKCASPLDEKRFRELLSKEDEVAALRQELEEIRAMIPSDLPLLINAIKRDKETRQSIVELMAAEILEKTRGTR
jgi:integrase/recombinase XerD